MKTIIKKVFSQLPNNKVQDFVNAQNKNCGVKITKMPAKIGGCFQPNFTRLTVIMDEYAIGKTCNGQDFFNAVREMNKVIQENNCYQF